MDFGLDKAGKDAVDEAGKVVVPELDVILQKLSDKIITGLEGLLNGRVINITIKL